MNNSIKIRTPGWKFGYRQKKKQLSHLFFLCSFRWRFLLIYWPVIDHYFVSDDFKVLYRVCLEHTIFIKIFPSAFRYKYIS
jgi:hypothetical protein